MLSDADRSRIEAAVTQGELRTRGEIYTVVARNPPTTARCRWPGRRSRPWPPPPCFWPAASM
uniref:Uncharacterized protein n=1 Tax=Phenylobacterium glaciei TaxID=2803784 RepID=A0A974P436_9CAUL|nr:hypothetical protein JKL49_25975 [Phenylobacterium glaciei]